MKNNKVGSVLIYSLVLVTLSLIMASIILKSSTTLSLNRVFINTKTKLSRVITDNSKIAFKLARKLNSNGSGFIDNLSCPTSITMSGVTNKSVISTSFFTSNSSVFCSGSYLGHGVKIYFNSGFTDLTLAEYRGSLVSLVNSGVGKIGMLDFTDSDSTKIDFSGYDYTSPDGFDDNANSDNYSVSSTGSVLYNDNFQDDDALHRKIKFGYVLPGTGFNSIFWNNSKTSEYIEENINNTGSLNANLGSTSTGVLFINLDTKAKMFLYKLDKGQFEQYGELKVLEKLHSTTIAPSAGFIQNNGGVVSLSGSLTTGPIGNEYLFDFIQYDYALLLENTSSGVLSYNIRGFNSTGSGLYLVPIDDSDPVMLKYLGNNIIIDDEGKLIYEQKELVSSK